MKRILVIGAGSAGLTASKSCKEDGLEFVCYEKSGRIGGLWNYHEDNVEGESSVMRTTVINSSKELSAFSDFPPPKEFPNFMHNKMMLKYLMMYAEHFGILEHIRNHHEVQKMVPSSDYVETGRWDVTTKNLKENVLLKETFDGVMICTGHHGYPHMAHFEGQEDFEGKIVHSHVLKVPDAFKDQRVLVVGFGNSALDSAVDLTNVAKQVYVSTRRGGWIMFRLGKKGLPNDSQLLTRFWSMSQKTFGPFFVNAYMEQRLNERFNHTTYNVKPDHRFDAQHLSVNDHLPNKILSGTVQVKENIKRFTEKGVIFEGEKTVTKIDSVVMATGYKIKFPFLSNKIVDTSDNRADLYKYMFPPHLKHPTLAVIGLIQPFGPLYPIFEAQSRWFVQLVNKKVPLPSCEEMSRDVVLTRERLMKRYVGSPRHTVQVDFIDFLDEIYSKIGARPNGWKILLTDPRLWSTWFYGPGVSYQYRLQGPHKWSGARQAIVETKDRIMHPLQTRTCDKREYLIHTVVYYIYDTVDYWFPIAVIMFLYYMVRFFFQLLY